VAEINMLSLFHRMPQSNRRYTLTTVASIVCQPSHNTDRGGEIAAIYADVGILTDSPSHRTHPSCPIDGLASSAFDMVSIPDNVTFPR
jgi:hypothetical protein